MRLVLVLSLTSAWACAHPPAPASAPPPATQSGLDARPAPRRRLEHVVTLGHDEHLPGSSPSRAAQAPSAPGVVVQNNVFVNPPLWGWGSAYRSYVPARVSTPAPATGTPPVAGDWPAPPSYGPPLGAR